MNTPKKSTLQEWSEKLSQALSPQPNSDEKGSKNLDSFEIWHHHAATRNPLFLSMMLKFDQRR
jgi:hypothetical protein